MFIFEIGKSSIVPRQRETLVSGAVNLYPCQFVFSGDWEGLERTAVFTAGRLSRSVLLGEDNLCQIPWEVLETPSCYLCVGVLGTREGELVLPAIPVNVGLIYPGTGSAELTASPTPSIYEQILTEAAQARALAQSVRTDADNGLFDGKTPVPGEDYFTEGDKSDIVAAVLAALPVYEGEVEAE